MFQGGRSWPLGGGEQEEYSIGRDPNSDICIFSEFVSRRHATLVRHQHEDGSLYYQIVDGDGKGKHSANGLWINGYKLDTVHNHQDEDEILFGSEVGAKYYLIKNFSLYLPTTYHDDSTHTAQIDIMVTEHSC